MRAVCGAADARPSIAGAEPFFHQGKNSAEPLWFAVMCRMLWGANAPKELGFHFGDKWSERTYRAWASGDNEPPAGVLAILIRSPTGPRILEFIMHDDTPDWWGAVREDRRQAAIVRGAIREITKRS